MNAIRQTLRRLEEQGNLRQIPDYKPCEYDFSENDYLGIASDTDLRKDFLKSLSVTTFLPSASASRLLTSHQDAYKSLEILLTALYGRPALLFNSGYHANTGMIAALGGKQTLFVADKLVHASIIDGLTLSASTFHRFKHNDYAHLEHIIQKYGADYDRLVIVAESVYSMDGDRTDLNALARAKTLHPNCLLYLDEAHAVGVCGDRGLGLGHDAGGVADIVVGTFGKALASEGAFAVMNSSLRDFMINKCRSLIFSTALAPATVQWTEYALRNALTMDDRRLRVARLGHELGTVLKSNSTSHIQPLIIGDAHRVTALSLRLLEHGIKVLPIRTPTVPPKTERLRFSLSATMPDNAINTLNKYLKQTLDNE